VDSRDRQSLPGGWALSASRPLRCLGANAGRIATCITNSFTRPPPFLRPFFSPGAFTTCSQRGMMPTLSMPDTPPAAGHSRKSLRRLGWKAFKGLMRSQRLQITATYDFPLRIRWVRISSRRHYLPNILYYQVVCLNNWLCYDCTCFIGSHELGSRLADKW